MRRAPLVLGLLGAALLAARAGTATASGPADRIETQTPIKHVIFLMQENHSFDNYFGTHPRVDGIPEGVCMAKRLGRPAAGCVRPFHVGNRAVRDLSHSQKTFRRQFRHGEMDGFVSAFDEGGAISMGYYDDRDLPYYRNVVDNYVLFDRFFTSAHAGSVWNHLYWVTATPGNPKYDLIPPQGFGSLPTIFDRLEAKGIPWKFYVQNYDPSITFRTPGKSDRGSQIVWVPLLDYDRYIHNPKLFRKIVSLDEFYDDLANDTLPAVSYMAPSGSSEHPPGSIQAGERFVRTLINALMRSGSWDDTALIWSYDDWGGWYDHVRPPRVDRYGYGFRVPAILVSAYARRGYIDHGTYDFTSVLKFIEDNWGVRPLSSRDANAKSIVSAFDFAQGPRQARFLPAVRGAKPKVEPSRWIIYAAYAAALSMAALGTAFAVVRDRRRRPPTPEVAS
jgi:phospholipase C